MSFLDTLVVVIVVFLVFGPDKVPEVARSIGRGMREFRKAMAELERGVEEHTAPVQKELFEVRDSARATVTEAKTAVTLPGAEVAAAVAAARQPGPLAAESAGRTSGQPPRPETTLPPPAPQIPPEPPPKS